MIGKLWKRGLSSSIVGHQPSKGFQFGGFVAAKYIKYTSTIFNTRKNEYTNDDKVVANSPKTQNLH